MHFMTHVQIALLIDEAQRYTLLAIPRQRSKLPGCRNRRLQILEQAPYSREREVVSF
jgi:hypothetical protein